MMVTIIIIIIKRYNGVNAGTSDMSTMNSNIRIAATRCSLGPWFVSGICVDTPHKGDTEDDDDNDNDDDNNNVYKVLEI